MKQNLEKLYAKAPAGALATLATGAFFRGDLDELARVMDALEGKDRIEQMRFLHRDSALTSTILAWSLDCQTTYAKALEFKIAAMGEDGEVTRYARFMAEAMQRRLASLVAAMSQNCEDAGLAYDDVANSAGLDEMCLSEDAQVILAAVDEFVEQYRLA